METHTHTVTLVRSLPAVRVSITVLFFFHGWLSLSHGFLTFQPTVLLFSVKFEAHVSKSIFLSMVLRLRLPCYIAETELSGKSSCCLGTSVTGPAMAKLLGLTVIDLWRNSHVADAVIVNAGIVF